MARMQSEMERRGEPDGDAAARRANAERGFAAMDQERQRAIASEGGRAAHRQGVAHEFSSEEARAAGRKGGASVSRNREHMAAIGAMGGRARAGNLRARLRGDAAGDVRPADPGSDIAQQDGTVDSDAGTGLTH
jgi:general stress protein YciG